MSENRRPVGLQNLSLESAADPNAASFVFDRGDWFGLVVGFGPDDRSEEERTAIARKAFESAESVSDAFRRANHELLTRGGGREPSGLGALGASAAVLRVHGDSLETHHVGNVCVYRWRDGELTRLTVDHSLLEDYIRTKNLSPADETELRRNGPHRTVVVRALGVRETVEVESHTHDLQAGDEYWLVSNAIPYALDDEQIASFVRTGDLEELVARTSHPERTAAVLRVKMLASARR